MKQEAIDWLKANFSEESVYYEDGYYRFRKSGETSYELAFLVPCACGSNNVHPQITLEHHGSEYVATKLVDMEVTPPVIWSRNGETSQSIDQALISLMEKFRQVKSQ